MLTSRWKPASCSCSLLIGQRLYNARPQWLVDAHAQLDVAVAAAYGWPADITDDAALNELLARNRG